jgi:MFS transporter, Spinster family, sphingosine-1-phosphate transporter
LGLLTGLAFALFYSIMGIPIARWADRGNRITIITLTTALWSAAVALCGLATSFFHLLLIRISVAVGEAGCMPPAHSLIADHYDRAERPRAVARYMLGGPASFVIGYFAAGWLNELVGWRWTFVLLAIPGLLLALIVWLTLREPRHLTRAAASARIATAPDDQPSMLTVLKTLWRNRTFRQLLIAFSIMSFFGWGVSQWKPAFFMRSHGVGTGELGTWFAAIYGLGGMVGTYLGGEFAARRAASDERLQLRTIAFAYSSFGLLSACAYLAPNFYLAMSFLALATVGANIISGPLFAVIQTLVPDRMRAMSIALIYLFANLIGTGLGPLLAGALSDLLREGFGDESLRYALLIMCPGYAWAAAHLWQASRTVTDDLARVDEGAIADAQPPVPGLQEA